MHHAGPFHNNSTVCTLSAGRLAIVWAVCVWLAASLDFCNSPPVLVIVATICSSPAYWTNQHRCTTQGPSTTTQPFAPCRQGDSRLFGPFACGWQLLWNSVTRVQYWLLWLLSAVRQRTGRINTGASRRALPQLHRLHPVGRATRDYLGRLRVVGGFSGLL